MSDIYYEIILDHYRYPRNKGHIEDADIRVRDSNPLCGDEVEYTIKLDEKKEKILDIKFEGKGCAISQASASILSEIVKGKSIEEIKEMTKEINLIRQIIVASYGYVEPIESFRARMMEAITKAIKYIIMPKKND